jgi:hypothetical protein
MREEDKEGLAILARGAYIGFQTRNEPLKSEATEV